MALLGFAVTNEVRDKSLSDSLQTMLEGYDENSNVGKLSYLGSFMEVDLQLLLYPLGSNVVRTACCSVGIVLPVNSPSRQSRRKIKISNRSGFCIGQVGKKNLFSSLAFLIFNFKLWIILYIVCHGEICKLLEVLQGWPSFLWGMGRCKGTYNFVSL
ncbi:uncharacterized protein LOC111803691 isoform X1 [Cucurbita pepo subsp. pepo]|uniref:uncharacterized protein LOC111803691 isoform X1 n=1 Tax=Cucurbita pepo subsp. pepo TaxID=3664 RepID=UPI000C9D5E2D|nr:uncharacterized protein LOC111803691 isoform X1 [Cucurbita pepo subsp. pepo]